MRRLFLTSTSCNVLDEFVKLLDKSPSELTVAFIPTAANVYDDKYFIERDREKLILLGFKIFDLNIAGKTEKYLYENLKSTDIIFVAGGNSFYLLEKSIESGFYELVKQFVEEGKYYIGSSAGSVLAGSSISHVTLLDNQTKAPKLKSFEGFKLIDKIILPHYDNKKYQDKMKIIMTENSKFHDKIITLNDNEALVIEGTKTYLISNN